MEVRVLGPIEVLNGETVPIGGPRQRRIVAALAMSAGSVVSLDRLVDISWSGEEPPSQADRSLRTYVHRIRSAIGDEGDRIATRPPGYSLDLAKGELDADRFEELAARGDRLLHQGDREGAVGSLEDALVLWRGQAYAEFGDEPWAQAEANRLSEARAAATEALAEALVELGREVAALNALEPLIDEHPLRETPRRLRMLALYRQGRQAEALREFQEFRTFLIDDAGVEPSADLIELDRSIAASDDELKQPGTRRPVRGYEIHERIGTGAFADVFRGTQPALNREVAIKAIKADLANRPEFIRGFEAEAQIIAGLEHPHIVPLYDFWREPDRAYLVMRWLTGGSMESSLDRGSWPLVQVATMVEQIGAALAYAHRVGVVHRDIKSANILLDDDGNAYLSDFGIALATTVGVDNPQAALSEGSPAYASPEQLRREEVGPATDLHGLGIAVFEALAGQLPFPNARDKAELLRRQLNDPIPSVHQLRSEVPAGVDQVLARATAKAPADRYPTTEAFVAEFLTALSDSPAASSTMREVAHRVTEAAGAVDNPYKGLRAFDEGDAEQFYGRDRLVDELIDHLADNQALVLLGASGSGKSSAIRAGLVPALRNGRIDGSDQWFITTMSPGAHPFESLETALLRIAVDPPPTLLEQLRSDRRGIIRGTLRVLPDPDATVIVVIDQFEELFTLCDDEATRTSFLDAFTAAVTDPGSPIRMVATLRADFYDQPLRYQGFADVLKANGITITPLAGDELERAIVDPVARVGTDFEPGLVAEIIADVASQPGALPLMQYALTELFERRVANLLTIDAYRRLGGLSGALAARAEELFAASNEPEQDATRRLLGRLVTLGEGTEDTRRRVIRSELGDEPATESAIQTWGQARLFTFDRDPASREPTVEVAHEALIREWPRLRQWLDDDRDGLRVHRHLTIAATSWDGRDQDQSELYRGGRLDTAEAWATAHDRDLNPSESAFLAASVDQRNAEVDAEHRRIRRLRRLVTTTAIIAAIALIAGAVAFTQWNRAEDEAARADLDRLLALARTTNGPDPTVGLLLAVEAHRIDPSSDTLDALHRALTAVPGYLGRLESDPVGVDADVLNDQQVAVATNRSLDIWDVPSGARIQSIPIPDVGDAALLDVRTSAASDGSAVAVLTPATTRLYDPSSGEELGRIDHDGLGRAIALSSDGALIAVGRVLEQGGGDVEIYARSDLTTPVDRIARPDVPAELRWSPDGRTLAMGGISPSVALWDAETQAVRWETPGEGVAGRLLAAPSLLFSSDGERLIAALETNGATALRVLDAAAGTDLQAPIADGFQRGELAWLDEEETVVAAGSIFGPFDKVDLTTGEISSLIDRESVFGTLASLPSINSIVVLSNRGLDVHSTNGGGPLSRVLRLSVDRRQALAEGASVLAAPDDAGLLAVSTLGAPIAPQVFDLETGEVSDYTPADSPPVFVADAQGGSAVLNMRAETVVVRHGLYGPPLGPGIPVPPDLSGVALSPEGDRLLLMADTVGLLHDTTTGTLLARLEIPQPPSSGPGPVGGFSPDGQLVLFYNGIAAAALHDANTGEQIWMSRDIRSGFFGPDSERLAVPDPGGRISFVDLATRELTGEVLVGHTSETLQSSTYTSDRTLLATNSFIDGSIRVWDLASNQQLGRELENFPLHIDWFRNQNQLVVPTAEGVALWNYETDTWPEIACNVAGRNLTAEEWDQFGPRTVDHRATCPQFPLPES